LSSVVALAGAPYPATDRPARRFAHHIFHRHRRAEVRQALDHRLRAVDALSLEEGEARGERVLVRDVQREEMHLDVAVVRAQLAPRNDAYAELARGGRRLGDAADRVVVGERDGAESRVASGANHVRGRERAVGRDGVGMQVDEPLTGRRGR